MNGFLIFILCIIGMSIMFITFLEIKKVREYRLFQKTMKVNSPCCFYINESREVGTIQSINKNNTVTIEGEDGDLHIVITQDVYPFSM